MLKGLLDSVGDAIVRLFGVSILLAAGVGVSHLADTLPPGYVHHAAGLALIGSAILHMSAAVGFHALVDVISMRWLNIVHAVFGLGRFGTDDNGHERVSMPVRVTVIAGWFVMFHAILTGFSGAGL